MRKIILTILLASAAASPALAARPRDGDSDQFRGRRSESVEPRRSESARPERPSFEQRRFEPREQSRFQMREQASPRVMTSDPGWARRGADDNPLHAGRDPRAMAGRPDTGESVEQIQQRFERRQQAIRDTGGRRDSTQWVSGGSGRRWSRDGVGQRPGLAVSDVPRPGTQPALRNDGRHGGSARWNGAWRNDNRYNWQDQRRRHGSLFHLGIYYDPFGWGYQPYQVGWRMWPSYYGSQYWINDPGMYRLPYAPPGTRWIRYWDDALLVDTWTGEVVDRIPNFFW